MSDKICDCIVELRRQICPRTSYASSGKTGSQLVVISDENDLSRAKRLLGILKAEEFSEITYLTTLSVQDESFLSNVVVLYNCSSSSLISTSKTLLKGTRVKLIIALKDSETCSEKDFTGLHSAGCGISCSEYQVLDGHHTIALFVTRGISLNTSEHTKGFNLQPSVQTMQQFRFLWSKDLPQTPGYNWGKQRVLQRLADHSLFNSSAKMSSEEWNALIQKILSQGGNDRDIYSIVREKALGRSLDADLAVKLQSSDTFHAAPSRGGGGAGADDEGGDGRALHMVNMTLECIPTSLQTNPSPIKSVLDYGCAEGAITAEIGKALKLPPDRIYGADVRSIPSLGFTFLPLQAEKDNEIPALGSILPSLRDQSVDLITSAMVFHHVTHPAAILLELRRVISLSGVLIIREHHCTSADCGAFLDIIHGLYSLSWSSPVEWPDFLQEYKAFYRSREQWSELIQSCGFVQITNGSPQAVRHYNSAEASVMKPNGRLPNVTKAYYAVYAPNPRFKFPAQVAPVSTGSAGVSSGAQESTKRSYSADESEETGAKKQRFDSVTGGGSQPTGLTAATAAASLPEGVFESKKYPGRYYRINATTGAAEWLEM